MGALPPTTIVPYQRNLWNELFPSIEEKHQRMRHITRVGGSVAVVVSFLLLSAVVAVFSCVVCIIVLGTADVVNQFVLPVIVPVGMVLLISIPLMIVMVKNQKAKKLLEGEIADDNLKLIRNEQRSPTKPDKKVLTDFIAHKLLGIDYNKFYKKESIENIKSKLPKKKERTESDKIILEALDKASDYVLTPKEAAKADEREAKREAKEKAKAPPPPPSSTEDATESSSTI